MSENTPIKRDEFGRILPGSGPLPNSGRKPRGPEIAEGEEMLCETTPKAVKRLLELENSTDERIALGAVTMHLKTTIGVIERKADPNGNPLEAAWAGKTLEALLEALSKLRR